MKLNLILARARNGVIGDKGTLPWHLPEDMAHFKRTTLGCPVIMGRKTWESLPPTFRPLPGRLNVVVTRQPEYAAPGAQVVHSLQQACAACQPDATAWVIGGAELYAQALPMAQQAVVTEIDAEFDGDAHGPVFGPEWRELERTHHISRNALQFSLVTYRRELV